jgi:hypothetical protein
MKTGVKTSKIPILGLFSRKNAKKLKKKLKKVWK